MRIIVFGATGGTGREVVRQALAEGHQVTAFVRNPKRPINGDERLQAVVGDALDPQAVAEAIAGQDAVVVALGSRDRGKVRVRGEGTANVIRAMETHHVSRLVVVSAGGVSDSYREVPLLIKALIKTVLRHTYRDHEEQERHVRNSELDWVIVRPAMLTDGPATGRYHDSMANGDSGSGKVSRADVAGFVLRQLGDDRYLRKAVSIG